MTATTENADAAVRYILSSPVLARRFGPASQDGEIDWAPFLGDTETLSGGERLLVRVASDLWEANGEVEISELSRGLDRTHFERVLTALRIYRDGPAGALADAA